MKAVIVDQNAKASIAFKDLPEPNPLPNQAIVEVKAVSLNRGEVDYLPKILPNGSLIGWDFAGIVIKQAPDGSGPGEGARVVGFLPGGAWAELVAAPSANLAQLPDSVTLEQASTLPVAGLTAYYALAQGGLLIGKKILITGGTGGVGHFAIQLAAQSGADVFAPIRRPDQQAVVSMAGAQHVLTKDDLPNAEKLGPFDLIVDGVAGPWLQAAFGVMAPNGVIVNYGVAGGQEITLDPSKFFRVGGAKYYGLTLFHEVKSEPPSIGLSRLANLISAKLLTPLIDAVRPWSELQDAATDLIERKYSGKLVLTTD